MFIFPFLNLYILSSLYLFVKRSGTQSLSETILSVFIIFSGQIVITQTILGALGLLTIINLTISNFLISSFLIYISFDIARKFHVMLSSDSRKLLNWIKTIYSPYNLFLTLLLTLLSIWILLAAYLLPARGIDDITYHLTTIIEFIKNEKIFLLPIQYRPHVTMPLNAELLFMWPTIFYRNDYAFGLIQYIVGIFGVLTIYRFCIFFSVNKKISFFVAQLFIFTPVVIAQSGSAYIDLILSVFFLIALYYSTQYYKYRNDFHLYMSAIAIGLLTGMKYTALILVLPLALLIFNKELIKSKIKIIIFLVICMACGGYWYVRNFLEFGTFFPFLDSILRSNDAKEFLVKDLNYYITVFIIKSKLLYFNDTGIGSLHGGLGLTFWAIALPCSFYCLVKSLKLTGKKKLIPIFIWLQIIVGFTLIYISPLPRVYYRVRYSIFLVGIGLIALGIVLESLGKLRLYRTIIITLCCIFSLLTLMELSNVIIPLYRVDYAIRTKLKSNFPYSKMKFLVLDGTEMRDIWETLDFITRNNHEGLSCYFALTDKDFATPFYGSKLQNSIWNFSPDPNQPPEALIFHLEKNKKPHYLGEKITINQALKNQDYKLIDMVGNSYLFLQNKFLVNDNDISKSLMKLYEHYYSEDITKIKKITNKLDLDIPIVSSNYLGFVFTYLKQKHIVNNDIYTVPRGYEKIITKYYGIKRFYSVGFIPDGFITKEIEDIKIDNRIIKIYENKLKNT